jgi:predicted membrane channel-forming protein YqfA (hemolysin III family)
MEEIAWSKGGCKMERLKLLLIFIAIAGQIIGIILLFINMKIAIFVYILYAIAIFSIFFLLIKDRQKEKREDDENDYRNY